MNENENENNSENNDDLKEYWREMEELKSDFSDLEDLDLDELQEMKDAITQVKEQELEPSSTEIKEEQAEYTEILPTSSIDGDNEDGTTLESESEEIHNQEETIEESGLGSEEVILEKNRQIFEEKEELITDFSDIGKMDLDELLEMKQAVESVKRENHQKTTSSGEQEASDMALELERRLEEELKKKKEKEKKKEIITEEKLLDYFKTRRDKIWYHALYYLAFEVEDHIASKSLLYEMLKEVTSKSAIDPLPEHSFYFGLGYILRLTLNERQIVRYLSGGKFKINVNFETIKRILEETGEPISTRPIIKEEKKKEMFRDFLKEDFTDI